jgi:hypothetical protein
MPNLAKVRGRWESLTFGVVLIIGVIYAGSSLASDLSGVHNSSILPYLLLGLALLVRWDSSSSTDFTIRPTPSQP